jgi:hypothetical protein
MEEGQVMIRSVVCLGTVSSWRVAEIGYGKVKRGLPVNQEEHARSLFAALKISLYLP